MLAAPTSQRADLPRTAKDRHFSWEDVAEMDCDDAKLLDKVNAQAKEPLSSFFGMMPSLSSSSIASSTTSCGTIADTEPDLSHSLGSTMSFDLRTPLKKTQAHNQNLDPASVFKPTYDGFSLAYPNVDRKVPSALGHLASTHVTSSDTKVQPGGHISSLDSSEPANGEWKGPYSGLPPLTPASVKDGKGAADARGDDFSPASTSSVAMGRYSQSASPIFKIQSYRPKLSLPLLTPSAFSRPNVPQTPGGSLFHGARDGAATGAPMSPFVPPTPLVSAAFSNESGSSRGSFFDDGLVAESAVDSSPSPSLQKRQSLPITVSTPKQPRLTHTPLQRHGSIGMSPLSSEFASVSMRTDSRSSDLATSEAVGTTSTIVSAPRSVEGSPSASLSKLHTPPYSPLFLGRRLQDDVSSGPSRISTSSSGAGSAIVSSSKKRAKDVILGGGADMARSFSASRIKTSRAKAAPKPFNLAKPTLQRTGLAAQQPMSAPAMKLSFSEQPSRPIPEIRGAVIDSSGKGTPLPTVPSPSLLSPHSLASKTLHAPPMEKSVSAPPKPPQTVSARHLANHKLHPAFAQSYTIRDELGSGGFGFVVSAIRNRDKHPVAVKFIFKEKVPAHGWVRDPKMGVIPMEAFVLKVVDHPGVVKFIDLFDDELYFYLVMELHGTPWKQPGGFNEPELEPRASSASHPGAVAMQRRTSCDLFECIEQHSKLSEEQARWVFAQVVEVVWHLDRAGICHRDIKDENCVVDADFNVKLIDFGSAVITDVRKPTPYFNRFFGTMTFASSEILQGKPYRAPHAEIWSLGVLLSILLSGECPFADPTAAIKGRISKPKGAWSHEALNLLLMCLEVNPDARATIEQVRAHPWVRRAWTDRGRL
ncbi:hypothetical protein ACQY0O_008022 [Thecaphora frezii]